MRQNWWISVVVGGLAVAAIWLGFGALKINDQELTLFGQILGTLVVLSAVLERSLDMLLSISRAEKSDQLRAAVEEQKKIIDAALKQAPSAAPDLTALETAKADRAAFRAQTMRLAMAGGLVLGVVISAIGFRILLTLVDGASVDALGALQKPAFHFVDIVLTGAVLAGGSDGIHKLVEVYRNFTTEKG